ncbi:putative transcription regulator with HTH domain protein [Calothrix sp. NIES-4071]|nr:putative transcription regulator with HTH domain protein [Calothrix sp. NIES-4071]BAZ61461.1 putative transcription regulator with HTH domain protein [Calothrix sp. NIES-4105]
MTLTFDPRIIRNEEENEKALAVVEELMHRRDRSLEENELYDLLITLIEKFEQEYYSPGKASTPHSMLLFFMEQQDIQESDLIDVIGYNDISEIVDGKREITREEAKALGQFFHVDPSLFI